VQIPPFSDAKSPPNVSGTIFEGQTSVSTTISSGLVIGILWYILEHEKTNRGEWVAVDQT